jgi:PAS domain S-box-containing protein
MKNKDNRPGDAAELRRRAEKKVKAEEAKIPERMSPEDAKQALHELRVLQIELEMQNEELRRAQAELDAARGRYSDLYDLAPVGYCTLSESGLILEANLTAATLLGEARGALLKKPIARFILSEDQDIFYRHRKQLIETGEPQICELRMARKDGALFWARVEATAPQAAAGGLVCRAMISDITERKQAEENQVRLVAMLDATPGFVGFADAKDTHILYINPDGRKMVGVQAQEDVTRLKIADVHPEWTNMLFRDESIPTAIRDGMWTGECAFLNRDGREIPVMMALLAHKSPSGEVERFSTVSIDITERKRADLLERAVYEIARAPETAKSLDDLYRSIHLIIKGLMPADNFYVALYDEEANLLCFPYFVDEIDVPSPPQKPGKGLTEYVLRTGRSLLCDTALEEELTRRGEVELVGIPSPCWLGAPLPARGSSA